MLTLAWINDAGCVFQHVGYVSTVRVYQHGHSRSVGSLLLVSASSFADVPDTTLVSTCSTTFLKLESTKKLSCVNAESKKADEMSCHLTLILH